jgi:hypothetical protein
MAAKQTVQARAGVEAARSLQWRLRALYGDATTPEALKARATMAAWALSHFGYTKGFERAFLAALELEWHDAPMGGTRLRVIGSND